MNSLLNAITDLHPVLAVLVFCSVTVTLSYLGLRLVRKNFSEDVLRENHEVGGFIFNAFGLVYAVLIAFVVFATWTEYDNSKKNIDDEAIELNELYLNSKVFPDSTQKVIKAALIAYINDVVNDEWPLLVNGEASEKAMNSFNRIWSIYTSMDAAKITNVAVYSESLTHLNHLSEKRRIRIFDSRNEIPGVIWAVLLFGGAMTVIYTYFFCTKKILTQFIMTSGLTVLNTMILYIIYMLENPFSGYIKLDSIPFEYALQMINKIF